MVNMRAVEGVELVSLPYVITLKPDLARPLSSAPGFFFVGASYALPPVAPYQRLNLSKSDFS